MNKDSSCDSQETGRRQHIPLVALMAMGYLLAGTINSPGAGEGAVSAGRKESGWELTKWGVRDLGAGHHSAVHKHVGTRARWSMPGSLMSVLQLCCCWDCAPLTLRFSCHGGS